MPRFVDAPVRPRCLLALAAAVGAPLHAARNGTAVEGMVESVSKTGQVAAFAAACAARVDYIARKSCGDAVAACCAKDPRKPRFARVPSGGETCRFCLMLASRGAVYLSKENAGAVDHYHANCDCKAVPDWGDGIEGYDDAAIYRRWQDLEHADAAERAERNGTTEAEEYEKRMKQLGEGAMRANKRSRALEKDAKRRRETERAAVSLKASSVRIRYGGSFGGATADARKAYAASDASPSELFGARMGVRVETQGDFSKLGKAKHAAMYTGMEHACETLGYAPGKIRLVSAQPLKSSYAEARRRSNGVTVHVDPSKLAKLSEDEIEQIVFHEIAHGKEYDGLSDMQFDREAKRLARFQSGEIVKLPASTASKRLEKCLIDAGIQAVYKPFDGKMVFIGTALKQLKQLPEYAWRDAVKGTQDSELIAESLRFVANNGRGINNVADAIAAEFGGAV